jgi:hydrogenase maturation factor
MENLMDVYSLLAAMGGEIVRNRARVRVGDQIVVVGEVADGQLVLNEEGRRLVNQATSEVVEVKKTRKPRAATVESPVVASDAVEVGLSAEVSSPDAAPAE